MAIRFPILFLLLAFAAGVARAEGDAIATVINVHGLLSGIDAGLRGARARNREESREAWARDPITFPCAKTIAKLKAQGKELPPIVLTGERHDHPFCRARRHALQQFATSPEPPLCLGLEDFDTNTVLPKAVEPLLGLENPHVKALTLLMQAYKGLIFAAAKKRGVATPPLAFTPAEFILDAFLKPETRAVWTRLVSTPKNFGLDLSAPATKELVGTLSSIPNIAQLGKDEEGKLRAALTAGEARLQPLIRPLILELARTLPDAVAKAPENVAAPKNLALETAYALHEIEQLGKDPGNRAHQKAYDEWFDYAGVAWRDQIMAKSIALKYCEMLEKNPTREFHAVVGKAHLDGINRRLLAPAKASGIPRYVGDVAGLAELFDQLLGQVDEKSKAYPNQPLTVEKFKGQAVAISKQRNGARIVVLLQELDPLPGSPLHASISIYDPTGSLRRSMGLDPDRRVPPAQARQLQEELAAEYERSIRMQD